MNNENIVSFIKQKLFFKLILLSILNLIHIFSLMSLPDASSLDYGLLILAFLSRFLLIENLNSKSNLAQIVLWVYTECSFFGYYFFSLLIKSRNFPVWPMRLGIIILLVYATIATIKSYLLSKKPSLSGPVETNSIYGSLKFNQHTILSVFLILLSFILSYISFKLNITKMEVPHPILPFKLEPALNLFRIISIPAFFIFLLDYAYKMKWKKNVIFLFLFYLVWLLYESYIRGSRGALMISMFPILLLIVRYFDFKKIFLFSSLILLLGLPAFVTGNYFRAYQVKSRVKEISAKTFIKEFESLDLPSMFLTIYYRLFENPRMLSEMRFLIKDNIIANNFKLLLKFDGANKYYTHEIKKHPRNNHHNEGLTAFADGYIYFGSLGTALTAIILFIIAIFNDLHKILIINSANSFYVLFISSLFNILIWGDGFWDFYFIRSIFTILVFPLTLVGIFGIVQCANRFLNQASSSRQTFTI